MNYVSGDKDPALLGVFLNNFFQFMKLLEEIVEKTVHMLLTEDSGLKLPELQRKLRLQLRLSNFPKMKISADVPGLVQSLIRKQTGFLLCASGFVVMELICEASYPSKSFYRANCDCCFGEIRCVRSQLLQNIKEADDLSARPRPYIPKCKECNRNFEHLEIVEVYKRFKQLRVRNPSSGHDEFMLFLEITDSSNDWVQPGVSLEGVFFVDCISRLKSNTGRFLGENQRILLAIEVRLQSESECAGQMNQSILSSLRSADNYHEVDRSLIGEDFANSLFTTSAKNLTRLMQNLAHGSRIGSTVLDVVSLLAILWLKQNDDLSFGSNSLLKLLETNEGSMMSNEVLLNTSVSESKMNLLVYSDNPGLVSDRLKHLCKGLVGQEALHTDLDEASCIAWLTQNSNRLLVVNNFTNLPAKIRAILKEAAVHQRVESKDGCTAQLRCSFVIIEFSKQACIKKLGSEQKAREFFEIFDIIINLNTSSEDQATALPGISGGIEDLLSVFTSGCLSNQIAPLPAKPDKAAVLKKQQGFAADSCSQNSRLSYLYNKMCQKVMAPQATNPAQSSNTKRPFVQQSADEQAAVEGRVAAKILLGYCSAVSESGKLSQKHIVTLKKTALASGILRAIATNDSSALVRILSTERAQNFQVEVFDAVLSCVLMENSRKWSGQAEYVKNSAGGESLTCLTAQALKMLSECALPRTNSPCDFNSRQLGLTKQQSLSQRSKLSNASSFQPESFSLEGILVRIRDFMFTWSNYDL